MVKILITHRCFPLLMTSLGFISSQTITSSLIPIIEIKKITLDKIGEIETTVLIKIKQIIITR